MQGEFRLNKFSEIGGGDEELCRSPFGPPPRDSALQAG